MKTHIYMKPIITYIIKFLKIAYHKTTHYFNAFEKYLKIFTNCKKVYNNTIVLCKNTVNSQLTTLSPAGFSILNYINPKLLMTRSWYGVGTEMVENKRGKRQFEMNIVELSIT